MDWAAERGIPLGMFFAAKDYNMADVLSGLIFTARMTATQTSANQPSNIN